MNSPNFGTVGRILKIQKAKLVGIDFPVDLKYIHRSIFDGIVLTIAIAII